MPAEEGKVHTIGVGRGTKRHTTSTSDPQSEHVQQVREGAGVVQVLFEDSPLSWVGARANRRVRGRIGPAAGTSQGVCGRKGFAGWCAAQFFPIFSPRLTGKKERAC